MPRSLALLVAGAAAAILWLVLGAASAHAADNSDARSHGLVNSLSRTLVKAVPAPSSAKTPLSGAVSGILDPVVGLVDDTVAKVPVVGSVTGPAPVAAVTKPVVDVVRQVEAGVSSAPVVGPVVGSVTEPVAGVVTTVVTPIVTPVAKTVEQVTTPVLNTVTTVTQPVTDGVKPVVDPVVGVVAPVVDGVLGNGTGGGAPSGGTTPSTPTLPTPPVAPGTPSPGAPGATGGTAPGTTPGTEAAAPTNHSDAVVPEASTTKPRPATHKPAAGSLDTAAASNLTTSRLGPYRPADSPWANVPGASGSGRASTSHGARPSEAPSAPGRSPACGGYGPDTTSTGCLPAVTTAPAGSSASGGSSGGAGTAAANEYFPFAFTAGLSGGSVRDVAWSLPASMPADPGSSPD